MVEAAPSPSFKMSQPDLLLEFLIVALPQRTVLCGGARDETRVPTATRRHRHRRRADDNPAEDNSLVEDKPEVADRLEQAGSTAPKSSLPTSRARSLVPRWH